MFEYAESDPALTDDEATSLIPGLRTQLLKAQYQHLQKKDRALLIWWGALTARVKATLSTCSTNGWILVIYKPWRFHPPQKTSVLIHRFIAFG